MSPLNSTSVQQRFNSIWQKKSYLQSCVSSGSYLGYSSPNILCQASWSFTLFTRDLKFSNRIKRIPMQVSRAPFPSSLILYPQIPATSAFLISDLCLFGSAILPSSDFDDLCNLEHAFSQIAKVIIGISLFISFFFLGTTVLYWVLYNFQKNLLFHLFCPVF